MGKQLGVIQFSGRIGEVVGRKKVSGSSIDANIVSKFTAPSNPKTQKQAEQRAAFAAAKNFRDGFANLLNHAFQGVKYGQPSLNRFTKLVTLRRGADYDYLPQLKGTQQFIPQPWPLSRGSIAVDTTPSDMNDNSFTMPFTALEENGENVGDFWTKFLAKNPFFINGDMITIVAVVTTASSLASDIKDMKFLPVYDRMVIDSASEEALTSSKVATENGVFSLAYDMAVTIGNNNLKLMGVGIIVSRQNGNKAAWLRSNSDMVVRSTFTTAYRTTETINEAISSYMAALGNVSSDWYLNQTGDNEGSPSDPIDPRAVRKTTITVTVDGQDETYADVAYVEIGSMKHIPYVSATISDQLSAVLPKKVSGDTFDYSDKTSARTFLQAALTDYQNAFAAAGYNLIKQTDFNRVNPGYFYTGIE
jgi:hypothetical protein